MNKKQQAKVIDKLFYIVIIIEGLLSFPQLIEIITNKSSKNVSLLSWAGYVLFCVIWMLYAKKQKDKPLFIYSVMSFVIDSAVVASIIYYR